MIEYLYPTCLEEACNFAKELGQVVFIAGGTEIETKEKMPEYCVSLMVLKEFQFAEFDEKTGGRIGAITPLYVLSESDMIREQYPDLHKVIKQMTEDEKRRNGTLGGKIICQIPEVIHELLKLNAKIHIQGSDHGYNIELKKFMEENPRNVIDPDEIISEIQISIENKR